MPHGDRMGPAGAGPMTGRGLGFCAGYDAPGHTVGGYGSRGAVHGGRGQRHRFYATGLTGWERAGRGMQAWGGPAAPARVPAETNADVSQIAALTERTERLEQMLGEVQAGIARLEADRRA